MLGVTDVLVLRAIRSMKLLGYGNLDVVGFQFGPATFSPSGAGCFKACLVRSEIRLCSNSANIAMSWKNSMPVGVLVLTSSVSDTKWTFRFFSRSSVSINCFNDRPRRSDLDPLLGGWRREI